VTRWREGPAVAAGGEGVGVNSGPVMSTDTPTEPPSCM